MQASIRSCLSLPGLVATLGLALASASPAMAVNVFVHMYVDGQLGGQIIVDGASEPPAGTCGAHFINPDAWFWAEGEYAEIGTLDDLWNNGLATNSLTLTGQFTGCSPASYLAVTPATPDGHVPAGAISLVVEIDTDDIEWLDFNGNPVPEGPPPPFVPPAFDPCDFPGFCEDLTLGGACVIHPWLDICQDSSESDAALVQIADFAASIPTQTATARKQLAAGRRQDADRFLVLARQRALLVTGQAGAMRARQARIDREVANQYPSTGAAISLGNQSAGFEIGLQHTTACIKSLDLARTTLAAGRTPNWTALDNACQPAAEPLYRSRTWLGRLKAWNLRGSAAR
jgi:hypothetical protein